MHEAEQLTAVVQETTFRNEDNGYTVLRVGSGRSQQTVVGVMPELSPGENVTFEGYWTEHPVYGRQFNARACAITPPTGKSAIEKYLGSGLIRGIGPATAKLIVNRFGEKALDILGAKASDFGLVYNPTLGSYEYKGGVANEREKSHPAGRNAHRIF